MKFSSPGLASNTLGEPNGSHMTRPPSYHERRALKKIHTPLSSLQTYSSNIPPPPPLGIILTTTAGDKPTVGKVVAVGPGRTEGEKVHAVNVSVGATVLYSKYSGTEFDEGEKQYIVIREADVMAVLA